MTARIDRAALDDAAGRALFQRLRPDPGWPDWAAAEDRVRDIHRDWVAQVVDTVLRLITQGIEQQVDVPRHETTYEDGAHDQRELILSWLRSLSQDGGNPTC